MENVAIKRQSLGIKKCLDVELMLTDVLGKSLKSQVTQIIKNILSSSVIYPCK